MSSEAALDVMCQLRYGLVQSLLNHPLLFLSQATQTHEALKAIES